MLESKFQPKVIAKYEELGYFVIKLIRTNKIGIPDLLCLKPDKVLFVEVKAEKTIITPIQKFMHKKLISLGFEVIIERP
jgi:Holliday junction resolvase